MPTLRRTARGNITPFPNPPAVVTVPTFEPLHYSPLKDPAPTNIDLLSEVAAVAAAAASVGDESADDELSKSPTRVSGRKGALRVDDGDDESDNASSREDSKDPSYRPSGFLEDDELFYSDDEEMIAAFERGLDDVARLIEDSDPKKVNHGRRRTTLIAGGPQQPDYAGMNAVERDLAKAEFQKKRKAYSDACRSRNTKKEQQIRYLTIN